LLKHLVEQEKIPREKIAVVTGDQKELDGINLFAPDCPIDFVITVEALKEGWDCSFAYVFCSVATVNSRQDVEQILGRVLRMPYAKRRSDAELNRAYAHVSRASWPNAVKQLHDRLVDMGFEDAEADAFIEKAPELDLHGGSISLFSPAPPPTILDLVEDITSFALNPEEQAAVTIEKTEQGSRLTFTGSVSQETIDRLTTATKSAEVRAAIESEAKRHRAVWQTYLSPAQRGVPFCVPQLCFNLDGELEPVDRETLLDAKGWTLLDYPAEISEADFRLTEAGVQWEIDLSATGKITERAVGSAEQYNLDLIDIGWSEQELCRWLEKKARQADITQPVLLEFVRRAIAYLTGRRALPLTSLVRWRFILSKVLAEKISLYRELASGEHYQETLFGPQAAVETSFNFQFDFAPMGYAPRWTYVGQPFLFERPFYAFIGELDNKGEEYECAKALDRTGKVKHWVRNLERRGFSLPLAHGRFYPDFVAELTDGRILALEHKGKVYATNDDSKEKCNIGALWEASSEGKAVFLMTVVEKGRPDLFEQIAAKIG
jgi:type III restriction enzyme